MCGMCLHVERMFYKSEHVILTFEKLNAIDGHENRDKLDCKTKILLQTS